MKIEPTNLKCCYLLEPEIFSDSRGIFFEVYQHNKLKSAGLPHTFVQLNQSMSKQGVLRGLHFQKSPSQQAKLVRVIKGIIWDVAVDIDPESSTYGQWVGMELSEDNRRMALLTETAAHGFYVLSQHAVVEYLCSHSYVPTDESGIRWDDPNLAIDWRLDPNIRTIVSEKDQVLPMFRPC
ncbi:dTDP-4-dehydrorhamnose 3,5-epimerase [bacterium]|nr:dTDP-4-dehydrorhamnose 3,5-epimerase [bacterium]